MVTVAPWKTKVAFPAPQVEACIRDELQRQADDQALLRPGVVSPTGPQGSWEPEIDSLTVIEVICSIEELLGISLPDSFIPRGGYQSVDDCIQDLLAETQSVWVALIKKDQDDER
jgi:acyl carrier protein